MGTAYYNEHDADKAAWLRELIKANLIAPGEVDERSIEDVLPRELVGYTQCHFFAGIGIWSYALRSAGWPDDRPVWTGSCPCQPFSAAGQRKGFADERHLWPAWFHLIRINRPYVVLGEQTAKKDGFAWLDLVQSDLEAEAYAVGALGLPACGFGAPHLRERIFFVANAAGQRHDGRRPSEAFAWPGQSQRSRNDGSVADANSSGCAWSGPSQSEERRGNSVAVRRSSPNSVGDTQSNGRIRREDNGDGRRGQCPPRQTSEVDELAGVAQGNTGGERLEIGPLPDGRQGVVRIKGGAIAATGVVNGFWRDADAILCNDEDEWKWRLVEPGSFPLAHGATARILRLRGYGDGIVAPAAEEFIRAYIETIT